jgi:hypothetical protein
MSIPSETDRQRRVEFVRGAKGAVKQGLTIERREAARERKADEWTSWFHARMDTRGGEAIQHLPDALAELEERISDQVAGAVRELKSALQKALK